jgi:hypothetical protein
LWIYSCLPTKKEERKNMKPGNGTKVEGRDGRSSTVEYGLDLPVKMIN